MLIEIAKLTGKEKEIKKITEFGLCGVINWEDGLRRRIEILEGIEYKDILRVSEKYTLKKGVKEAVKMFKKNNFATAVITGGFDLQAKLVCKELGIDYLACNKLLFRSGKLFDVQVNVSVKDSWIHFFSDFCEAKITMAFGDGANDIPMVEAVNIGKILLPTDNIFEVSKHFFHPAQPFKSPLLRYF